MGRQEVQTLWDREVWSDGCQYFDEEEDPSEDEDDDYADSDDSGDQ